MKTSRLLLLSLALCGMLASACGATVQHLQLVESVDPEFPRGLQMLGITKGGVRCMINVDATGRIEDVLILAYTHERFGRAVRDVMPQWRFEPARVDGRAVPAQTTIEFTIEAVGVVTTMDVTTYVSQRFETIWGSPYVYHEWKLSDLDAIPVPQKSVAPIYPVELAEQNIRGKVRVEFYIDESGAVRMPIVAASEHPELAGLAIQAVRQWQFAPPLRQGKPVLVFASQEFDFNARP
jgi:TonB family protein